MSIHPATLLRPKPVLLHSIDASQIEPSRSIVNPVDSAVEAMAKKNPQLTTLMQVLGVDARSVTPIQQVIPQSVATNQEIIPHKPNAVSKLRAIAERLIKRQQTYNHAEMMELIQKDTEVNAERANLGIARMLESEAIALTPQKDYYLIDSTPF